MAVAEFVYRKKYKLGKIQFIGGPKGFTLCRRNEHGITNLKENCMVKTTSIYREYRLRTDSRALGHEYHELSKQGFESWAAYEEHKESIKASIAAIHRALKRYKDRRIDAGSFYMLNHPTLCALYLMSPLYTMPRKQASRKIRRLLQNREAYAQASIKTSLAQQGSNRNNEQRRIIKILLLYLFVVILACIIIFL